MTTEIETSKDVMALAQLKALLTVPGALKHCSDEHLCGLTDKRVKAVAASRQAGRNGRVHEPVEDQGKSAQKKCEEYSKSLGSSERFDNPLADPRHFRHYDIVSLEGPDEMGYVTAWCENGSWRKGRPSSLLVRLTEHQSA